MGELEKTNTMPAASTMDMVQLAVQKGASIEQLQQLMALHRDWEANEARKAYVSAMTAFKSNPPEVLKSKKVEFGKTKYSHALLEDAVDAIGDALTKHGLSFHWDTAQADGIVTVTCVITHEKGHSERVSLSAGLDTSGQKNNIQALGSTVTYLQRYTLFAATGTAARGMDDDAKSAEPVQYITANQAADLEIMLADTKSDKQKFLDHFKVDSLETFPLQAYQQAVALLKAKQKKAS